MSISTTEEHPPSAKALARDLERGLLALDLQQKLVFAGASAYLVLAWLSWWTLSFEGPALDQSSGVSGMHAFSGKLAWGLALLLASWCIVPRLREMAANRIPGAVRNLVPLILGAALLYLGPVSFFLGSGGDGVVEADEEMTVTAGRTLFFWLALAAAGTSFGAAVWKQCAGRAQ